MKRWLAIAAGAVVGVVVAGMIAPPLMMILPAQLRGPALLWATSAVAVMAGVVIGWFLSSSRGQ